MITFKDPIKLDEQKLKEMTCSHFEYAMHEDGNNYCKACHISEADVPTEYEELVSRQEAHFDSLREEGLWTKI